MRKSGGLIVGAAAGLGIVGIALGAWVAAGGQKQLGHDGCATDSGERPVAVERTTGPMRFGRFMGEVVWDETAGLHFLELRGARLPFKASPLRAQSIDLRAPGKKPLEMNTALLYAILGKNVEATTLLINPDEEKEVLPAAEDIARYVRMTSPRKFAGVAYTKPGGALTHETPGDPMRAVGEGSGDRRPATGPPVASSVVRSLEEASAKKPLIQLKGPKSGAARTGVSVMEGGRVVVEGKTYDDLYAAADLIGITVLKMLCGSADCPDAAACATGGRCGCGA